MSFNKNFSKLSLSKSILFRLPTTDNICSGHRIQSSLLPLLKIKKGLKLINMKEISIEKLLHIETKCRNPQDAIVIRLFLEGIEVHEIVYLKKQSLDSRNRTLTFTDSSGRKKTQSISSKCVEMYRRAVNQTLYLLESTDEVVALRDTAFLIKASLKDYIAHESMIQEMDSVILRTIYRRLRELADVHAYPGLTYLPTSKKKVVQPLFSTPAFY